jgi:hypothetical protein
MPTVSAMTASGFGSSLNSSLKAFFMERIGFIVYDFPEQLKG